MKWKKTPNVKKQSLSTYHKKLKISAQRERGKITHKWLHTSAFGIKNTNRWTWKFEQISIAKQFCNWYPFPRVGKLSLIIIHIFCCHFEARIVEVTNIRRECKNFVEIVFAVYFIKNIKHANKTLIRSEDLPPNSEAKPTQWEPTHDTCHVTPPCEIFVSN